MLVYMSNYIELVLFCALYVSPWDEIDVRYEQYMSKNCSHLVSVAWY